MWGCTFYLELLLSRSLRFSTLVSLPTPTVLLLLQITDLIYKKEHFFFGLWKIKYWQQVILIRKVNELIMYTKSFNSSLVNKLYFLLLFSILLDFQTPCLQFLYENWACSMPVTLVCINLA